MRLGRRPKNEWPRRSGAIRVLPRRISGAAVKLGSVELKGMALGTIVAILLSLLFWAFDRLGLSNDSSA